MLLKERRQRAQRIVKRIATSLESPNGRLKGVILDFRTTFLEDVGNGCAMEVWDKVFETPGGKWLVRNYVPALVRREKEHVFVHFLESRLETWRAN